MKSVQIIQNWGCEPPGTTLEYLESHGLPHNIVHSYAGDPMPALADCEAVIVLGCPLSVINYDEHEFLKKLYAFTAAVLRKDIPLLGICFGAQMISRLLGATVSRNDFTEVGLYRVRLTPENKADPACRGFEDSFEVFHWHNDALKAPRGTTLLVEDEAGRHQVFRKGRAIAQLFHLEQRAEDIPGWCDEYPDELAAAGKTREGLLGAYAVKAERLKELNFRFLDNFFA